MSDVKGKTWIKNYVLMLINELKDVPKEERDKVQFRLKMTSKHKTFSDKFPSLLMILLEKYRRFYKFPETVKESSKRFVSCNLFTTLENNKLVLLTVNFSIIFFLKQSLLCLWFSYKSLHIYFLF